MDMKCSWRTAISYLGWQAGIISIFYIYMRSLLPCLLYFLIEKRWGLSLSTEYGIQEKKQRGEKAQGRGDGSGKMRTSGDV